MAKRTELEAQEEECRSSRDYLKLAQEAVNAPADLAYAGELLQRAERACSTPNEYRYLAEFVAKRLEDSGYARDLYLAAASVSKHSEDLTNLAISVLTHAEDRELGASLLLQASRQAMQTADPIESAFPPARAALEKFRDESLAQRILEPTIAALKSQPEIAALAGKWAARGDTHLARWLYHRSASAVTTMTQLIEHAAGWGELFDDMDQARRILGDAEADCQTTEEFVTLAGAYQRLFQDEDRGAELMELAVEYAIEPADQLALADGYWRHYADADAALTVYHRLLESHQLNDLGELRELSTHIGGQLGSPQLAARYLQRAEDLAPDLETSLSIADQAMTDLVQAELAESDPKGAAAASTTTIEPSEFAARFVADSLQRSGQRFDDADSLLQLGNKALSFDQTAAAIKLFAQSLHAATDCRTALRICDQLHHAELGEQAERSGLQRGRTLARVSGDFQALGERANRWLNDRELARELFIDAEQRIADLEELDSLQALVHEVFPMDGSWRQKLINKGKRLQTRAGDYRRFRAAENGELPFYQLLQAAADARHELGDRNVVRKILLAAEHQANQHGTANQHQEYRLAKEETRAHILRMLIVAIGDNLGDPDWLARLLDAWALKCDRFAAINDACSLAHRYLDAGLAAEISETYLNFWQQQLFETPVPEGDTAATELLIGEWIKLSRATRDWVGPYLVDADWPVRCLERAANLPMAPFARVQIGAEFRRLDQPTLGRQQLDRAFDECTELSELRATVRSMQAHADVISEEERSELYRRGTDKFLRPKERLIWVEGILPLFNDSDWARAEYIRLQSAVGLGLDKRRFRQSVESRLGRQWRHARTA